MAIEYIQTNQAPRAIGPYSQAIKAGGFVYLSGQLGLVPASGELAGGDVAAQTTQALENLRQVLLAAGTDFRRVVDVTIFLTDMNDFPVVNRLYEQALGTHRPARATVQVAALPKQAKIEIKLTALA